MARKRQFIIRRVLHRPVTSQWGLFRLERRRSGWGEVPTVWYPNKEIAEIMGKKWAEDPHA